MRDVKMKIEIKMLFELFYYEGKGVFFSNMLP